MLWVKLYVISILKGRLRQREQRIHTILQQATEEMCVCSHHGICYQWTGGRENQKGRVWRKTRMEEFHGVSRPEMSIYWNRCTHTQKFDTPVPNTGCFSYKAPTPSPRTQGNWKQDKSLHRFPSVSTLCYGSEFCSFPHRYVNCSRDIYLATCHSQPWGLLIKAKATQTRAAVLHLQLRWISVAAMYSRIDHP